MNLQCPLCFKEFPMFDQRGFRNAGFTAHHNRCVEKEVQKAELSSGDVQRTIHQKRRLLPAPTHYSPNASPLGSLGPPQRPKLTVTRRCLQKQRASSKPHPPPDNPTPLDLPADFLSPAASSPPKAELSHHKPLPQPWELQEQFIQQQLSLLATVIEEQIPVHYCDYCLPQQGLHHPSCTLLHFASRANNAFV
ncbi:hypothetical protein CLU79DRAFT_886946 [Phycomyces nitens]|nr:hypothetical protein CLU79DRAFT_886946 [Phycomyces nitens]